MAFHCTRDGHCATRCEYHPLLREAHLTRGACGALGVACSDTWQCSAERRAGSIRCCDTSEHRALRATRRSVSEAAVDCRNCNALEPHIRTAILRIVVGRDSRRVTTRPSMQQIVRKSQPIFRDDSQATEHKMVTRRFFVLPW